MPMKKENENVKIMDANDFIDVLELRSDLLFADEQDLEDAFSDEETFIKLIKVVYNLIDIDNGKFIMLDKNILKVVYNLINIKRLDIKKTNPETFNLINEIITKLNNINNLSKEEKEKMRINYLINQANLRNISFYNLDAIIDSMGIDGMVMDYIDGDELVESLPEELIVGSIIYLNTTMPDLFKDEEVKERIEQLIDIISKSKTVSQRKIDNVKKKVLKR